MKKVSKSKKVAETVERVSTNPIRIQRKRTKGWKMPENTVYVGRPTKWGNPFGIHLTEPSPDPRENAVLAFEASVINRHSEIKAELRGKNLCCWCHSYEKCHADVLLEIANS